MTISAKLDTRRLNEIYHLCVLTLQVSVQKTYSARISVKLSLPRVSAAKTTFATDAARHAQQQPADNNVTIQLYSM